MTLIKHSLEKSGFVAVKGGNVHYRYYEPHNEKASKQTPIIFIHGGPGACHLTMYNTLNNLANTRPALFYDQLGSHFSPAEMTPDLIHLDRFTDEIIRLMKALNINKATLLGHSWGGTIATEFALNNPEKIDGLILSSPLLSTRRWIDDCNILLNDLPHEIQDTIRRCEVNGTTDSEEYKKADKFFSAQHYYRQSAQPEAMVKNKTKTNKPLYNAMWGPSEFTCQGSLKDIDLFPRLHEITTKTLLICGEYDTATPAAMKDAQAEIKNSRLSVIPDSGHVPYFDNNEAYLRSIENFLDKKHTRPVLKTTPEAKIS